MNQAALAQRGAHGVLPGADQARCAVGGVGWSSWTRLTHDDRFDPATLAIGTLVLLAFRADFRLVRDPAKGWTFAFHTKPLSDNVIGQLLGVYGKSDS